MHLHSYHQLLQFPVLAVSVPSKAAVSSYLQVQQTNQTVPKGLRWGGLSNGLIALPFIKTRSPRIKHLTISVLNAQSVGNKSATISTCILEKQLDVLAVVETWHDTDSPSLISCTPPNYRFIEQARQRTSKTSVNLFSNHGGLCVIFSVALSVNSITLPFYNSMEVLAVSLRCSKFAATLLTIYRPGSASITNLFFDEFSDVLERCSFSNNLLVVGDINIHLDDKTSSATKHFQSLLDSFGLIDCVNQPTHRQHHQLDVFIVRSDQQIPVIQVDPPVIADHALISASFQLASCNMSTPPVRPLVRRRKWQSFDLDRFSIDLMGSDLLCNPPEEVNEYFKCYDDTLTSLLNKHAPVVYVKQYAKPASPWFDTECHLMKVKTRKLEKIYRTQPSSLTESAWRAQFHQQRILFQTKLQNYWKFAIESSGNNNKVLWSKLRCLLQSPVDESSTQHSPDDFAKYFTNKIDKIRLNSASAPPPLVVDRNVLNQLSTFSPVTPVEVMTLLSRSPAKQCTLDPIPTWLLKQVSAIISPVIAGMCNASLEQQVMPAAHKMATVHPLLKKPTLDSNELSSFRPISNLSFVSKTLERLVNRRLTEHTDKQHLLPDTQSAYRQHYSTETALAKMHNDIVIAIDRGNVGALVLLDLSAAFDTVDHSILIDILRHRFGIVGNALNWMMSYLDNRSQQISIGPKLSTITELSCGVPQGSVLGPKQFLAYTEDLVDIFHKHEVSHHGYADDSQGFVQSDPEHIDTIVSSLQATVHDVSSWCSSRRLKLNEDKTELLWFGTSASLSRLSPADMKLQLDGTIIEPSHVVRDLGVFLDSELSMRDHVSRIAKSCFFQLRRIRPIRRQLGRVVTQRLVAAFVMSRIDYCNAVLAELPTTTLAPLQRVQNAAARLVLNLKQSDHITPALIELHWLPVKFRIIYKLCMLVHKSQNGLAPSYIKEMFKPISELPSRTALRSASTHRLYIPATRLNFGNRALSVAGVKHWNALPEQLRALTDTPSFKRLLKTHLFRTAFNLI